MCVTHHCHATRCCSRPSWPARHSNRVRYGAGQGRRRRAYTAGRAVRAQLTSGRDQEKRRAGSDARSFSGRRRHVSSVDHCSRPHDPDVWTGARPASRATAAAIGSCLCATPTSGYEVVGAAVRLLPAPAAPNRVFLEKTGGRGARVPEMDDGHKRISVHKYIRIANTPWKAP